MEIKAGRNSINIDFSNDLTVEEKTFLKVARLVIDEKLGNTTETTTPIVEETVEPITQTSTEPTKEEVVKEGVKQPFHNSFVDKKKVTPREFLEGQDRMLIVGECACEKDFHFWADKDQETLEFVCKRCNEAHSYELADLIPANYKCHDCSTWSTFWTPASQMLTTNCKRCNETVDLFYHDKKQIMTTL